MGRTRTIRVVGAVVATALGLAAAGSVPAAAGPPAEGPGRGEPPRGPHATTTTTATTTVEAPASEAPAERKGRDKASPAPAPRPRPARSRATVTGTTTTTTTTTTMPPAPVAEVVAAAVPTVVAAAAGDVTLTFTTWHVLGLDSNDVTAGPNVYPTGVRACNGGGTALSGLTATFAWDTASPFLDLEGPAAQSVPDLAPGACTDLFWNVVVDRDPAAYGAARRFHVVVSGADGSATTPVRELFVERLNSQNRNSVLSITGPTNVTVGDTVAYVVDAKTAPGGYEQVEAFLAFPSPVFRLVSVAVAYGTPAGATADIVYADACGWDDDFTSPTYQTCIGPANYPGGKAGDSIHTVYTFVVVGTGTGSLSSAIYDKSGSSYHYNTDFGAANNLLVVTAVAPPAPVPTTVPAPAPPPAPAPAGVPGLPAAPAPRPSAATAGPLAATGSGTTVPLVQLALSLLVVGVLVRGLSAPRAGRLAFARAG